MSSFGDAEDYWRGLDGKDTHTIAYKTAYGIPDLFKAAQQSRIPRAAKRHVPLDEVALLEKSMHTIHAHFEQFDNESLQDCLDMCNLHKTAAKKFAWPLAELNLLFGKGPGQGATQQMQVQRALGLPVAEVGKVYLVRPERGSKENFLIGIARRKVEVRKEHGVNMQWFSPTNKTEPVKSVWVPDNPTSTRDDCYPFVADGALQYPLQASFKRNNDGVLPGTHHIVLHTYTHTHTDTHTHTHTFRS